MRKIFHFHWTSFTTKSDNLCLSPKRGQVHLFDRLSLFQIVVWCVHMRAGVDAHRNFG